ncbi:MAG: HlyD family type I secretion periplasmic adaptor subunit [Proteobacteria bacterium]|nr:HlyD family type I secretion periplasmic adaptor subunit [Pseudomonadota bacterium]MBU1737803.1 HlyD family type I secretion periplasmic adaptor subunit [Pseudomonadota bacterium]
MRNSKDDSHEFKPLLVEIEEQPVNPLGHAIFWIIIAASFFAILWMCLGKVDVVVTSRGKVIPKGEVKVLQPLTTGVLRAIHVKPGDFVEKGQVLIEIDPSGIEPELESMKENLNQLDLELQRLNSLIENKPFAPDLALFSEDVISVQMDIYQSTKEKLVNQLKIKNQELRQNQEQLETVRNSKSQSETLLKMADGRHARLTKIKDLISNNEYDSSYSEVLKHTNDVETANHRLEELLAGKEQIFKEIEYIKEEERNRLLTEYSSIRKNYVQLKAEIDRSTYFNARQQLTSPAAGYVSNLFVHTIGGVVSPAEKLISIVPSDTLLEIKTKVLNKDIGFIAQNMDVTVKIDTFNFQKYGTLNGTVRHIAKDSIDDEQMGPIYEVYVTMLDTSLIIDGKKTLVSPGMSVTAEINVGKRRVIEFFIYPIIKYLDEGISVR